MGAIDIRGLKKDYKDVQALRGLDLSVEAGQVYGFCGPNGAGKSTTLKILVGLVFATGGEASLKGIDAINNGVEARKHIGYLPESYGMPNSDTPRKFLTYMGILSGMSKDVVSKRIEEIAKEINLTDNLDRKIKTLSKGNKQRIGIAQALIHDPDILLFDEPTTGLDPLGRNEVLDAMKAFANRGKTVLFSTHILSDVEKICDTVGIIHNGLLIEQGSPEELRKKHGAKDLDEVFLKVAKHG
ncbi:MAG: ABC transporter ATP-binding protein [Candidatus Thermoplasmatota archaeon]|nr:ABC transporter ATP-binding protein [Euryarchaeota archaeon]MBU4032265.1 ABC transporter ATP-binding protein [Candidatus Thermoplasmatota archaeon]MBU4145258.1 ABC transporter ATP-binding protein [Candidatus Thermoplasmatota archaeon]MBU4591260.1 ABC transporter ATP-binding protein [Candidatus Thermoplasmatota archaeon]